MTRILVVSETSLSHGSLARRLAPALAGLPGVDRVELRLIDAPGRFEYQLVRRFPALGSFDVQPLRWRLRDSAHAWRALHAGSGDVALINTQAAALLAGRAMRERPTVISVDCTNTQLAGLEYWQPRTRAGRLSEVPLDRLERRAYAGAAKVLAWTEWTARSVRDDYGIAAERIVTLHPGVTLPARREPPPGGPLRVLFVGNFARRKGLDELLAAAHAATAEIHVDALTNDADDELPLDDPLLHVHRGVSPGTPEHRACFARAGAFVFPTRADAVPWVVVEALAAGLPVLATDVGAISELVGDAGIVVARGDGRALTEGLDRLAADTTLRADLGARARARAEARYDAERQLPRLLEALRDAV